MNDAKRSNRPLKAMIMLWSLASLAGDVATSADISEQLRQGVKETLSKTCYDCAKVIVAMRDAATASEALRSVSGSGAFDGVSQEAMSRAVVVILAPRLIEDDRVQVFETGYQVSNAGSLQIVEFGDRVEFRAFRAEKVSVIAQELALGLCREIRNRYCISEQGGVRYVILGSRKLEGTYKDPDALLTDVSKGSPSDDPRAGDLVLEERFDTTQLGQVPHGWSGSGLDVQAVNGAHALQLLDSGSGFVEFQTPKITNDFQFECLFETYGYVNRERTFEVEIHGASQRIARVRIIDKYPNLTIELDDRVIRWEQAIRKGATLAIDRIGKSLQVKLNGQVVTAKSVTAIPTKRIVLRLGQKDVLSSNFATIRSVRLAPVGGE